MATKMQVVCNRCNAIFTGKAAHQLFDQHKCAGMRDLMTMPSDLLLAVIKKQMTEEQAWAEADKMNAA
jgi:hypothetical protein